MSHRFNAEMSPKAPFLRLGHWFFLPNAPSWGTGLLFFVILSFTQQLSWGLSGEESTRQYRRPGFDSWVGKIPCRGAWQPSPVFLPGEFHGQRNLVGYSPGAAKESDVIATKQQVYPAALHRQDSQVSPGPETTPAHHARSGAQVPGPTGK